MDEQRQQQIYEAVVRAYRGQPRQTAKVMALLYKDRLRVRLQYDKPIVFMRHSTDKPYEATHIIQLKNLLSTELSKQFYSVAYDVFNKAFDYDKQVIAPKYIDVAVSLIEVAEMLNGKASFKNAVTRELMELVYE